MKKLLFLSLLFSAIISTTTHAQAGPQAQGGGDAAAILQQMKEKQAPGLIEKVGLTAAQAEKVIEINYEIRMQTPRDLKDMNEADRSKKLAELKALKEKKLAEFLTPEQINSLNAYYAEMRKNMPQRSVN